MLNSKEQNNQSRIIVKPYKVSRQQSETPKDCMESVEFMSGVLRNNSERTHCISNHIKNPENLLSDPQKIGRQFNIHQNELFGDEKIRGKRVYSLVYNFSNENYPIDFDEASLFAQSLLEKYPDYKSVAAISEQANGDINVGIIFDNYSNDGSHKMTKDFRPYHGTNIYNAIINNPM